MLDALLGIPDLGLLVWLILAFVLVCDLGCLGWGILRARTYDERHLPRELKDWQFPPRWDRRR